MAFTKVIKATSKAAKKVAKRKSPKATEGTAEEARKARKRKPSKSIEYEAGRRDPESGGSVAAAKDVETGKAGKVTRGSASVNNFIKDQMALSKGMKKRDEQDAAFYKAIREAETEADKKALKKAHQDVRNERAKVDKEQSERTARKISASTRGKKKAPARTDYVDPETGEIFGKPTPRQVEQAIRNAKARGQTKIARSIEAKYNEIRLKEGKTEFGESKVGPRKKGSTPSMKGRMAKGGLVNGKQRIGATDYRKSGCTISSVDRRKKK